MEGCDVYPLAVCVPVNLSLYARMPVSTLFPFDSVYFKAFSSVSAYAFVKGISRLALLTGKGLGSIRGVFGPMSKFSFTLSNYRFVIWDKNYRRYFVI